MCYYLLHCSCIWFYLLFVFLFFFFFWVCWVCKFCIAWNKENTGGWIAAILNDLDVHDLTYLERFRLLWFDCGYSVRTRRYCVGGSMSLTWIRWKEKKKCVGYAFLERLGTFVMGWITVMGLSGWGRIHAFAFSEKEVLLFSLVLADSKKFFPFL